MSALRLRLRFARGGGNSPYSGYYPARQVSHGKGARLRRLWRYLNNPDYGVQVLGVISETNGCTPSSALAFLRQRGYEWLNMRKDSVLGSVFNTCEYVPQTLIVIRDGRVLDHCVGSFPNYNTLKEYVDMWIGALAHLNETCTVTFKNAANDAVLATLHVPFGGVIILPDAPQITGYTFTGWQVDPDNSSYVIDSNILVTHYDPCYLLAMGKGLLHKQAKCMQQSLSFCCFQVYMRNTSCNVRKSGVFFVFDLFLGTLNNGLCLKGGFYAAFGSKSAFPNRPFAILEHSFCMLKAMARMKSRVSFFFFPLVRKRRKP